MKTTVFFATLLCWELVSAYPFPETLPYYGAYEPVAVPEQRVISQPIQISNLARSQDPELAYQQRQLAYLQQENLRRQNYENLLRNQQQQQQVAALNQRIANQLLIPTQPEQRYNNAIPLSTVREPYINSIPLQRPIQSITRQYYQNQQLREPYETIEAPQQFQVQNLEPASPVQPTYQYNQQYPAVPHHNAHNVLYDPRIRQALASSPLKKRYLVLHPNGTIEHIDRIEHIVERHPNYILVNAGDIRKVKEGVTPASVQPVAPVSPVTPAAPVTPASPEAPVAPIPPVSPDLPAAPVAPLDPGVLANATTGPVTPVAPLTPVVPPTSEVPTDQPVSATPAPSGAIPPPLLNGTVPGPKPTVPPTGPTTTPETVTAQTALPPQPPSTTLAPPPVDATTTSVPVETTITPPVVNAAPVYPLPDSIPVTTENPTTASVVNSTATEINPPPSDSPIPTPVTDLTVVSPPDDIENPVNPAPENATAIACDSQSPKESAVSTNVTSVEIQADVVANVTATKSKDLIIPDLPFTKSPTKPIVWFRSTDLDFFDKLTSGNETFDIVYFFNVPREPRVLRDTKTIIHANGTVVEETVETICDDEDAPPRVIKTRKVTNPDDAKPET